MIGSSTLIVKNGDHYCAHVTNTMCASFFVRSCKKKRKSQFEIIFSYVKKWKKKDLKPEADNLTLNEVMKIARATHCCDDNAAGYHKLAGDGVELLDLDNKTFKQFSKQRDDWQFLVDNY